jgi:predicted regulator of Ras-like GTPase activity (Roadblock/LC7/MglB family)
MQARNDGVVGAMRTSEQPVTSTGQLNWLLDDLVGRVPDIEKAVILSRDGLAIGVSSGLGRDDAERLAAIASGVQSLARGAGLQFGGGQVRQTLIEMDSAFLFITAAGEGSSLAVLCSATSDAGIVAYEMAVLVKRVGQHLSVGTRPSPAGAGQE